MCLFNRSDPSRISITGLAAALVGLGLAVPPASAGCFDVAPSESIWIELVPGKPALLEIYADPSAQMSTESGVRCMAWIEVPLSLFPTSRLASRPADVARSMRQIVQKLGARECDVNVYYTNDTGEEIAEHELCLRETFEFAERKHWSKSSEAYCWTPEDLAGGSVE